MSNNVINATINISIDVLKVHPKNTEFFDDISGEEYEQFKNSIKNDGIISPIIVSPDMTIISGHQRYKAAKELNIDMIPVMIRNDLTDEDEKLKILLAANFGRTKNDESKKRKIAVEYVRLCGYKPNGDRSTEYRNGTRLSLDEIASQLGTTKRNLQRALSIERKLTEQMKELLDNGNISFNLASDVITKLSEDEQEELIKQLDVTKKYTQKEVQKYIDQIKQLKKENEMSKSNVHVQVPDDYEKIKRGFQNYKAECGHLQSDIEKKVREIHSLRKQLQNKESEIKEKPEEQFKEQLKNDSILFCSKVALFIQKIGGYIWLTDHINEIPDSERKDYIRSVQLVKEWADTMQYNINNKMKGIG